MIWIYVVIAIAGVVSAFMEFYVRFLPARRANMAKRSKANKIIREEMNRVVDKAENYKKIDFFRQIAGAGFTTGIRDLLEDDAPVSKKMFVQLDELERASDLYNLWLDESRQIVTAGIGRYRSYSTLVSVLQVALGTLPEFALAPMEGYYGEGIHEVIFKGKLTFEKAKEVVLKGRWESNVKSKVESGEEKEIVLSDVLEGEDFHRFIEELRHLQERESIKMLRDAQSSLLEKARIVQREVLS